MINALATLVKIENGVPWNAIFVSAEIGWKSFKSSLSYPRLELIAWYTYPTKSMPLN